MSRHSEAPTRDPLRISRAVGVVSFPSQIFETRLQTQLWHRTACAWQQCILFLAALRAVRKHLRQQRRHLAHHHLRSSRCWLRAVCSTLCDHQMGSCCGPRVDVLANLLNCTVGVLKGRRAIELRAFVFLADLGGVAQLCTTDRPEGWRSSVPHGLPLFFPPGAPAAPAPAR